MGKIEVLTGVEGGDRFARLLDQAREILNDERFFNWQVTFPGVWSEWESNGIHGGFDAVIGNPPWDRMQLQQIEWFASRRREIALARRAAARKRMIADLEKAGDPLAHDFATASERAVAATRMARTSRDYPLLSSGDINLYSLFVERAMTIVKPDGMVGLLTPSGIASDKTAARFFKGVSTEGRLRALYDFENRRTRYDVSPFFPDVDSRFKFCVFVASPSPTETPANCAVFLQDVSELDDPERCFPLTAADFDRVNPNTGTAPIFRTRRDAELTTAIYGRLPVLVDRSSGEEVKAWPVKYTRMFDMANDSGLFRTREELEEKEGAYPVGGNRFSSPSGDWADHWVIAFKDITAATNRRTMIAAIVPQAGAGHTLPLLPINNGEAARGAIGSLIVANLNTVAFDSIARHKVPTTHFVWFVLEQLPVVPLDRYEAVLELTYTAHDMAPFARDMGYVDASGKVKLPFTWDEDRRLILRSKLDAVFFYLYGVTDRDDIRYIYSTFPIVEREEKAAYGGVYRSCELCLAWMNALTAGEPDVEIKL